MKKGFGRIAMDKFREETHAEKLLDFLAYNCRYSPEESYETNKGGMALLLKRTEIKHRTEYRRAAKKLIDMGFIRSIKFKRRYVHYILTEECVKIAQENGYKFTHNSVRSTWLQRKQNNEKPSISI